MKTNTLEVSIVTARKWYKSSTEELKELALQLFPEKELKGDTLPTTWEEWLKDYTIADGDEKYYINDLSKIEYFSYSEVNGCEEYKNTLNTREDAEAHLALMQLHVLRDCYRDSYQKGWKPDWRDFNQVKYCMTYIGERLEVDAKHATARFLSFPTEELAEAFAENFRHLIEKAKDLI